MLKWHVTTILTHSLRCHLFDFSSQTSLRSSRSLSTTTHLVVNAVGTDRPGIVSEVTQHVVEAGGNVGESQAAKLGHHFSLMMLLTVPSEKTNVLKESVSTIEGINASIFETDAPAADVPTAAIGCKYE